MDSDSPLTAVLTSKLEANAAEFDAAEVAPALERPRSRRPRGGRFPGSECLSPTTGPHRRLSPVRLSFCRLRIALALVVLVFAALFVSGLTAAHVVLFPRVDSPERAGAVVVVAGADDDRYVYARHLAEEGVADHILVSQPSPEGNSPYATMIDSYCEARPVTARDGRQISIDCFKPDVDTTEGETTAATRIARERGWDSLLVVTYWGHVSRVRLYFEQCFDGAVYVTDTPRPLSKSRKDALLHETGGYVKALLKPAC